MQKMHLVSIMYKGRIFTAFVTFTDGKPVLNQDSLDKITELKIQNGVTFSIG